MAVKSSGEFIRNVTDPAKLDRGQYCRVADSDSQSIPMDPDSGSTSKRLRSATMVCTLWIKCENVYKKNLVRYTGFQYPGIERAHSCLEGPILLKCGR
jgi:hypothetical protein